MRKPTHAGEGGLHEVRIALAMLRQARDLLKSTNHPRALEKVRRAITSTAGAIRHHENRPARERRIAA